jgi:hypothetical protein
MNAGFVPIRRLSLTLFLKNTLQSFEASLHAHEFSRKLVVD